MSGAFPESIKRAEEVLQHTQEALARADGAARGSLAGGSDGGQDRLSTEVRSVDMATRVRLRGSSDTNAASAGLT